MAVGHIHFDQNTKHGADLRRMLNGDEASFETLKDTLATMALMIEGDGSQAAHFAYMTTKYGFASDAKSKEAWEELNSYFSKLSGNGSVTDVNAAMLQVWNKFR